MQCKVTATQDVFNRIGGRLRVELQVGGALFFDAASGKTRQNAELTVREAAQLAADGYLVEPVSPAPAKSVKDSKD